MGQRSLVDLNDPLARSHAVSYFPSAKFDGFPYDEGLVHPESTEERKKRERKEKAADKLARSESRKRRRSAVWTSIKGLLNGDDDGRVSYGDTIGASLPVLPRSEWRHSSPTSWPPPRPASAMSFAAQSSANSLSKSSSIASDRPMRDYNMFSPVPVQWYTPEPSPLSLSENIGSSVLDPLPHEVTLNPYLRHNPAGPAPVIFDINLPPYGVTYTAALPYEVALSPSDFAQLATWPRVTRFRITSVADDSSPHLPWPVDAHNPCGVTLGDVLTAISTTFHALITHAEFNAWSGRRRDMVARAYWHRMRTRMANKDCDWDQIDGSAAQPGIRRADCMADKCMFRGLEPSPARDGTWMLFLGPA
ncbi:hypothetical protein CONPUDRAFT_83654 [Coniophora puteana RWD-64-598 SS2]|uniref:DUF6699 domain-containing protein n=1 Tax=Coniophora puteana (strain RWD-64-598) TaxID=741705 RepID=A0A5M3MGC7_CONPW|nr:uncharacterized protein CONPUDRAFT_83654 [Coniophora puteana RWD-64-598 SS2]EIW78107.1 hypothetical protein CONPUDRAFT_83654 [Coniophora puteana RWD-64-598 SS2]